MHQLERLRRECIQKHSGVISIEARQLLLIIEELMKFRGINRQTLWDDSRDYQDPD